MKELSILNESFESKPIRVIETNNERRMSAVDCCAILEYERPSDSWNKIKTRNGEIRKFITIDKLSTVENGIEKYRDTDTLNLEGIIRLCMLAKTDKAERFRDWAGKVLVRQFIVPDNMLGMAKLAREYMDKYIEAETRCQLITASHKEQQETIKKLGDANHEKEQVIKEKDKKLTDQQPFVDYIQPMLESEDTVCITDFIRGLGLSADDLFPVLRKKGILLSRPHNHPALPYIKEKYFVIVEYAYIGKNGKHGINKYPHLTQAGKVWLKSWLKEHGYIKVEQYKLINENSNLYHN